MSTHTVTIGETTFDDISYDREADVLYLSVGKPRAAAQTYGATEGHAVRYDAGGQIIGITLVNVLLLLDHGDVQVTVPPTVDVGRDELALALARHRCQPRPRLEAREAEATAGANCCFRRRDARAGRPNRTTRRDRRCSAR